MKTKKKILEKMKPNNGKIVKKYVEHLATQTLIMDTNPNYGKQWNRKHGT